MGKSAGKSAIPASPIFVGKHEYCGVCKQVADRWAGSIYEGGSRASVGTKPAPEMEPVQEWWAASSLYFIFGRD